MKEYDLRWEMVPYFHGKVLDIGENREPLFPHFIHHMRARVDEPKDVSMYSSGSLDGVFTSGLLDLLAWGDASAAVIDFCRVVRQGGSITVHLPKRRDSAQWEVSFDNIVKLFSATQRGWDLEQFLSMEDHVFAAFRLPQTTKHTLSCTQPDGPVPPPYPGNAVKKCGVVRLGAFGDLIQASSILPWLKQQGYHVTLYCSDHGLPVIEHDPHVDRFIIQGRNEIPPAFLVEFYNYERQKYDKWVNLCESVEATLLAAPGHSNYDWPNAVRAKYMDRNYLEFTHELAEVPPPYNPAFYDTIDERAWARAQAKKFGRRNVLWSLAGSSVHKTWPHMDAIIARIMLAYSDVSVVLVGDDICKVLETGWFRPEGAPRNPRVHCRSGEWTIRESMAFAKVADLIIGTETGLLNAAGTMDTAKIVTLSHSSEEMLTKHWKNTIALSQPAGVGCPKQPCRQLHTDGWASCMKHENGTAVCQHEIDAETMWAAVVKVLGEPERMVA